VGTAVFFLARDLLGAFTETWLLWYGLMFMGIVLFKPEGIAGAWQDLVRRRRTAGTTKAAGSLAPPRG
jgi:branched-chain amino acid transport system permease protein